MSPKKTRKNRLSRMMKKRIQAREKDEDKEKESGQETGHITRVRKRKPSRNRLYQELFKQKTKKQATHNKPEVVAGDDPKMCIKCTGEGVYSKERAHVSTGSPSCPFYVLMVGCSIKNHEELPFFEEET
ncbi:uncharacterized protein EV154DRAFT_559513 [Mucor mucedo]|uniref:uncharacterized protein n=1 Tax=Mucor mucedo TaxID=29922 RepID=UPI00221F77DF|nr:uncharacterized protein EV154DRAFT_559513 [Mucor mucedo]KAI7895420.1 hypothetical protein EV154DRAFT_559513 [Mucor mucedo]